MTEEVTTQKRPRGRPRKVVAENQPTAEQQIVEEQSAMQEQLRYQFAKLFEMVEKSGLKMEDLYPTPPKADTLIEEPDEEIYEPEQIVETRSRRPAGAPPPGTYLPGGNWIPWRKQDLDPADTVEFVPQPVPSLVFPMLDEENRQKIRLDVNDLICWLTVGIPNKVNRVFYNAYMNSYDTWRDLENFKRNGPDYAPWGRRGPDGRPSWHYEPMALTAGMDDDGHYLVRGGRHPLLMRPDETGGEAI